MKVLGQICKYIPLCLLIIIFLGPFSKSSADDQKSSADDQKSSPDDQRNKFSFAHFQSPDYEYVIGPGDSLEVLVWKEPELTRNFTVRIDGRISIPLLGDIKVSGETIGRLAKIMEERFKEIVTEPIVSVTLLESRSWHYYVIGKVGKPGEFTIDRPVSVLQAIAKCGGFAEWAKTDQIKIIRPDSSGKHTINFNFEDLAEKNDLDQDLLLGPGDIVLVP